MTKPQEKRIVTKPTKKKKQQKEWQYKFSFGLALVMLMLVGGYFVQSFMEIRKVKPVSVALERISARTDKAPSNLDSHLRGNDGTQPHVIPEASVIPE
jgi:hypothetical protein